MSRRASLFSEYRQRIGLTAIAMTTPVMADYVFNRKQFRIISNLPINLCTGCNDTMAEAGNRAIGIRIFLLKPVAACN